MVYATLVVEDVLQAAVAHKVIASENIPIAIHRTIGLHGAGFIDANIGRFARASAHGSYVVIRDLHRPSWWTAARCRLTSPLPQRGEKTVPYFASILLVARQIAHEHRIFHVRSDNDEQKASSYRNYRVP